MDPVTKPSHRDAVGLVPAPELILLTLWHTVHLWEHRNQLCVHEWEQQQLVQAASREQSLMETTPEPRLGGGFGKTKFLHSKTCPETTETYNHGAVIWQHSKDARKPYLPFQLFWDLKNLQKKIQEKERDHQKCVRYLIRSISTVQVPVAFQGCWNAASTCTHVLTWRAGWRCWLQTHILALREIQFINKLIFNLKFPSA